MASLEARRAAIRHAAEIFPRDRPDERRRMSAIEDDLGSDWPKALYPHGGGREWSTSTHNDAWKEPAAFDVVPAEGALRLTADELHCLTCAMAGNFPDQFAPIRMDLLRKLAKASRGTRALPRTDAAKETT